jgi:hypothetical protein
MAGGRAGEYSGELGEGVKRVWIDEHMRTHVERLGNLLCDEVGWDEVFAGKREGGQGPCPGACPSITLTPQCEAHKTFPLSNPHHSPLPQPLLDEAVKVFSRALLLAAPGHGPFKFPRLASYAL